MTDAASVPGLPGRYRIEGPLGSGGQAQTLAATDVESGEAVVVKVFRLAGTDAWKRFELFERECAVLRSLEHPSIPRYVEHGGDEDSGTFHLVMERARGRTLQSMIDRGKRFTDTELKTILDGLLDALAYLHSLNPPVIHRDVKPGNVVVGRDDHIWLVDFGSVRDVVVDHRQSTVVGTYGYMAPEQLRGQSSPASDLYGLGATMAAAATGADAANLPTQGLDVDLASVIKPGAMRDLLQWLLRADPGERPESVEQARRGRVSLSAPVATPAEASLTVPVSSRVQSLARQGKTVQAISVHRQQSGASLQDAKVVVDGLAMPERGSAAVRPRTHEPLHAKHVLALVPTAVIAGIVGAALSASAVGGVVFALGALIIGTGAIRFRQGLQRGLESDE